MKNKEKTKVRSWRRQIVGILVILTIMLSLLVIVSSPEKLDDIDPDDYNDNPKLKQLLEYFQGKNTPDSLTEMDIVEKMIALDDLRVMDILIAATRQKENYLKWFCRITKSCFFNGKIDFKQYYEEIRWLSVDRNINMRCKAAYGLIKYRKNPEAVKAVLACLDDGGKCIALILGEMEDPSLIPVLIPYITKDEDGYSYFANCAGHSVGKLGNDSTVPLLIEIIENDKTKNRMPSMRALGALWTIGSRKAIPFMKALLEDPCVLIEIKISAISVLGSSGDKDDVDEILPFLGKKDFKHVAIYALGEIGDSCVVPHIIPCLKSAEPKIRLVAVETIGKTAGSKQVADLLPLLEEKDYYIRLETVKAIAAIGENSAFHIIKPMLKDESKSVRMQTMTTLFKINKKDALPLIITMLDDNELNSGSTECSRAFIIREGVPEYVRELAAIILKEYNEPNVLPVLRKRLEIESEDKVRIALEQAIGKIEKQKNKQKSSDSQKSNKRNKRVRPGVSNLMGF